jgi:uncharacterized membrane protein (UPF0127 family)
VASFLAPLIEDPGGAYALRNLRTGGFVVTRLEPAFDRDTRNRGLLGRTGLPREQALVLAPCNAVHMFFMKFPIDVVYVDREGRVVKVVPNLRPWRVSACWGAFAAIEMAADTARRLGVRHGQAVEARHLAASAGQQP